MAEMNVSWKQSSAASRPTAATRYRHTSSRWASRKRWNGGLVTGNRRYAAAIREIRGPSLLLGRQPPEHRRRAVALLAELDPQRVEDGEDVVRPDRLEPLERAARVVEAEPHAVVDVLSRPDALGHGEARLVDQLAHDPAEHEPGRVLHPGDVAAEAREEGLRPLGRDGRRRRAARQLDEPRVAEWREGVEADRAAGRVERVQRPVGAEHGEGAALERGLVVLGAAVDRERRHVALGAERLDGGVARARGQLAQLLGDRQVAGDDDEPPAAAAGLGWVRVLRAVRAVLVGVPAAPGLAPVAPGRDELRHERVRAPPRLAEAELVERFGDLESDVDPDEVRQLERPH